MKKSNYAHFKHVQLDVKNRQAPHGMILNFTDLSLGKGGTNTIQGVRIKCTEEGNLCIHGMEWKDLNPERSIYVTVRSASRGKSWVRVEGESLT